MTKIVIKTKKGYNVSVFTGPCDSGGYEVGAAPLSETSIFIKKQIRWDILCRKLKNYLKELGWKKGKHAHIFCTDNEGIVVEDWGWDRRRGLKIYKKLKKMVEEEL